MKSYRIIWIIVLVIIFVVSLVFSQVYIYDYADKENMESNRANLKDEENENKLCQIKYYQAIQSILTSPSVDPAEGYLTNKDVLKKINAVENSCKWNNRTDIEKIHVKFNKLLSDTDNPKQLNQLLLALQ